MARKKQPPRRRLVSSICSLPRDILMEVLARVASSSLSDLRNVRLCCKDFLSATEDDYIYQSVSMEEIPFIPWNPSKELSRFLDRCMECGNAEALFRRGTLEYFSFAGKAHDGFERLKMAATKGHREAMYVSSVILILSSPGSPSRELGIQWLLSVIRSGSIARSRDKVERFLRRMWIRNKTIKQDNQPVSLCQSETCNKNVNERLQRRLFPRGWPASEEDDVDHLHHDYCEFCRVEEEVTLFRRMIRP